MRYGILALLLLAACGGGGGGSTTTVTPLQEAPSLFVNWENLSVHPLALTPDGSTLLACNTPDARLEIFDVTGGTPVAVGSVSVGLDPISVRARTDTEAWVVNHISDSVSVVDLPTRRVRATLVSLGVHAVLVFALWHVLQFPRALGILFEDREPTTSRAERLQFVTVAPPVARGPSAPPRAFA